MPWLIVLSIYLLLVNATAFFMMAMDKRRAVRQQWRISEKALFIAAAVGGGVGGTAGMYVFHHKTKHWYFAVGFPALAVIQCVLLFFILR